MGWSQTPVAVIDIGSNSVRLVIYDSADEAPSVLFNEKELCELGRGLEESGRLHQKGVKRALQILPRFQGLIEAAGAAGNTHILATAAAREAEGGKEFLGEVEAIFHKKVTLLSGEEEAFYSATGTAASFPQAQGIIGDLGGGSLELAELNQGKVGQNQSLKLGPLRFSEEWRDNPQKALTMIRSQLSQIDWLGNYQNSEFYAVGGAWRNLARLHMDIINYPLRVIDHYQIGAKAALEFLGHISSQKPSEVANLASQSKSSINKSRAQLLPFAALLLQEIIKLAQFDRLYFSANGLREGFLQAKLHQQVLLPEPALIVACRKLSGGAWNDPQFIVGNELAEWISPLIPDHQPRSALLAAAACTLCNIGQLDHPEYRAEQSYWMVLRAPLVGLNHSERRFLAIALAGRNGKREGEIVGQELLAKLDKFCPLSKVEMHNGATLGLAMRLAFAISGGRQSLLSQFSLTKDKGNQQLHLEAPRHDCLHSGDSITRRLAALAKHLELEPKIIEI